MPARQARRCSAHRSTDARPCENYAMNGSDVCHAHGGRAPQVARKAAGRVATNEALAELARRGITPVDNPLSALAELAGEILAVKDIFRARLAELEQDADTERQAAVLGLYERALDRSARVLGDIARLKIDERLMAVTEHQAQTLVAVFTAVLEQLDLGEQAAQVRELVAVELERVGDGG